MSFNFKPAPPVQKCFLCGAKIQSDEPKTFCDNCAKDPDALDKYRLKFTELMEKV